MEKEELLTLIHDLSYVKDTDGNDVPNFCFASDVLTELGINSDFTEEDIAKEAINNGYFIFKVFPGETMEGGLVIVAENDSDELIKNMYSEFYDEAPEIVAMHLDADGNLTEVEEEKVEEDVNISERTITDEERWGDCDSFVASLQAQAKKAGATLELKTKVGPKKDDAFWYQGCVATIKKDNVNIEVWSSDEDPLIELTDGTIFEGYEELEAIGCYNDETFVTDYLECIGPSLDYYMLEDGDEVPVSGYDLGFDSLWSISDALSAETIERYFEEYVKHRPQIYESRKFKTPKVKKTGDPNAKAMWGRTRSQTFKQKKGKGSFTRHSKHRVNEAWVPLSQEVYNEFIDLLNAYRMDIDYTREEAHYAGSQEDLGGKDIHFQIMSRDVYEGEMDSDRFEAIVEPFADALDEFRNKHKLHITWSIGFGGTNMYSGKDCTGRVTAGIDIAAPWVDDDELDLPTEVHQIGEGKKSNELTKRATKHKKTDKKGARGWFVNPNAGNVETNIQHFNHVNGGEASSTITAPAGLGEDVHKDTPDVVYDYELTTRFARKGWSDKEDKIVWFVRIPETAYEVKRDTFANDRLLRRRKNRHVMQGVMDFFSKHPKAKTCIISARYDDGRDINHFANTYRALSEGLEESMEDYYVVSDGKNPRNSEIYSEKGRDTAIKDAQSRKGYWEVLHYVKGNPEVIWTSKMNEDIKPVELSYVKGADVDRFEAHPRDDYLETPWRFNRYSRQQYPQFKCPSDSVVIYKDKFKDKKYILCPEANKVCADFFKDHPRNAYCVLRGFDKDNHNISIHGPYHDEMQSKWGYELHEKVEKHDTLNPKLWDEDNHLKPEVREKILEIAKEFTDGLEDDEIKFKVNDIVIVGSNCSYNYNDKSDLDVHIRMDTDSLKCPDDLYPLLYSAYRSLFNKRLDIDFYGIPVELYVETDDTEQMSEPDNTELEEARATSAVKSNGIYSVLNDKWIKEPVATDIPDIDQAAVDAEFVKWDERYKDIMHGEEFSLTPDLLEKLEERIHYVYKGPIYRFGRKIKDFIELHTLASSLKQAQNNFMYKAADKMGYDRGKSAQIDIDKDLVFEFEPEVADSDWKDTMRCERCGRLLTDDGQCPFCDLGDESVLDESVDSITSRIEEIEEFIEDIYDLRKTSIAEEGEYGIGNLVFKEVRNLGYLDNLRELKNALKSRKLSL